MREVRFHIHRKSTFAGALLPYRMYINGQYIGTIRNGKSLDANVPKAGVYYIEDDILSSRNAVIYDNGLSEYSVVIKRAGGRSANRGMGAAASPLSQGASPCALCQPADQWRIERLSCGYIETAFESETGASEGCSSLNAPAPP